MIALLLMASCSVIVPAGASKYNVIDTWLEPQESESSALAALLDGPMCMNFRSNGELHIVGVDGPRVSGNYCVSDDLGLIVDQQVTVYITSEDGVDYNIVLKWNGLPMQGLASPCTSYIVEEVQGLRADEVQAALRCS